MLGINIAEIFIKQIPNGIWRENCYVVSNETKGALIIDPGSDHLAIQYYCDLNKLQVHAILNTHGHYDHIGAIKYLKNKYNIPLYMHSKDSRLVRSANLYKQLFEGEEIINIPTIDYFIDEINNPIKIGDFLIDFISTPGHTSGSVCILIKDCLFTGDTLLKGKVGRVDLPGGDPVLLKKSLIAISKLSNKNKIFPGHGKSSTIKKELETIKGFLQK